VAVAAAAKASDPKFQLRPAFRRGRFSFKKRRAFALHDPAQPLAIWLYFMAFSRSSGVISRFGLAFAPGLGQT
jgi:hypothetical protein